MFKLDATNVVRVVCLLKHFLLEHFLTCNQYSASSCTGIGLLVLVSIGYWYWVLGIGWLVWYHSNPRINRKST